MHTIRDTERTEDLAAISTHTVVLTTADKLKGVILFALGLVVYSFFVLMVKLGMRHYRITPQEIEYYVCLPCLVPFFVKAKLNK